MGILDQAFLNLMTTVPQWVFWIFIAVATLLTVAFFLFPNQIRNLTDKYHVSFVGFDNAVRRIAMLAVRLYVVKLGIEDTRMIGYMKTVAQLIETLYPKNTGIKLSELVDTMNDELAKRYGGTVLDKNKEIVAGVTTAMVNEIVKVGDKVNDNEHDPMVNPREISSWIKKGVSSIKNL